MLDFESKLTEGGVGTVHLHEAKDFSHGRFILALGKEYAADPKILFETEQFVDYTFELKKILQSKGELLVLKAKSKGALAGLELLLEVQYVVTKIAELLELDISKPKWSLISKGMKLYRWKKKD
ncbi:MAG: hypothetical protein IPH75_14860 [bacterium]|nr:hypothetical protein [bacterium]